MSVLLKTTTFLGLGLTFLPSLFYLTGFISLSFNNQLMLGGALVYFISAPWWMDRKPKDNQD